MHTTETGTRALVPLRPLLIAAIFAVLPLTPAPASSGGGASVSGARSPGGGVGGGTPPPPLASGFAARPPSYP